MKIARIETIPLAIPHDHGGPPPAWGGQAWQGLTILLVCQSACKIDPPERHLRGTVEVVPVANRGDPRGFA